MSSSYRLGQHYERFIQELVSSGQYASANEVLRDGLRLIEERERLRKTKITALRTAIQDGLESGEPEDFDFAEFLSEARALTKTG